MVTGVAGLLELVADAASVGLLVTTLDDRVVWANQALRDLVGGDDDRALPERLAGLPLGDVLPGVEERERAWTGPDGTRRWLDVKRRRLSAAEAGPGADEGLLLYEIADVTARHERDEQAWRRERHLFRVEELARAGTWEWDLDTDAVTWSDELLNLFGYPPGTQLDYHQYRSLLHPEDVTLIEGTLARALQTGEPFTYTHRMYLADRVTLRSFECYGEVVSDDGGRPVRVLGAAHDVTEQQRTQAELSYLAEHDPLTGLPNRRGIVEHLRERLDLDAGRGAVLLVDIDDFKVLNDLHGHAVGDQILRGLAPLLLKWSDRRALLARLAGDEFAIALPEVGAVEALAVAESLCDAVARHPFVVSGIALRVTVSIGVAPLASAAECDLLLANADHALSEAKARGRQRAQLFAVEERREILPVSVLQRVHAALDAGRMALDAQPIVDLASRTVVGHELLLRLRDGLDPRLEPARFLPSVERAALMLRLDRWVVERAVEALADSRGAALRLGVNLSGRALEDQGFGEYVIDLLRASHVAGARLGFEVSEAVAITDLDGACRLAERLRAAGCQFTLDDFGAGFGSFVYLKHLPFTAVKIAGELVRQSDQTATDRVLVESVVRAARGLGMRTIAEHVDREALLPALHHLGVDGAQGFHLGRPRPLADLLRSGEAAAPP
jgi:diguanylate cyclase (GGDEF)-like protein/PAS domain S-box-containing protein